MRELVGAGDISPATQTRLRVIRRLVYALIAVVSVGAAVAALRLVPAVRTRPQMATAGA